MHVLSNRKITLPSPYIILSYVLACALSNTAAYRWHTCRKTRCRITISRVQRFLPSMVNQTGRDVGFGVDESDYQFVDPLTYFDKQRVIKPSKTHPSNPKENGHELCHPAFYKNTYDICDRKTRFYWLINNKHATRRELQIILLIYEIRN